MLEIDGKRVVRLGDYFSAVGPLYNPETRLRFTVFRPATVAREAGTLFDAVVVPTPRDADAVHAAARRFAFAAPRRALVAGSQGWGVSGGGGGGTHAIASSSSTSPMPMQFL